MAKAVGLSGLPGPLEGRSEPHVGNGQEAGFIQHYKGSARFAS